MKKLAARLDRIGHNNCTHMTIEGSRHETLNELNREQHAQILLDWLGVQTNQTENLI